MNRYVKIISECMRLWLNVLLEGYHGVGKTQMVLDEAKRQGLILKYYSSATLDPWADLVGIPVPIDVKTDNGEMKKRLEFIRPADVERADILFFDELNRAHPKVLNAVLETIQFHSINGQPLPNLKMVWAAMNPPGDIYQVSELDPVLVDRFHVYLEVAAEPSADYYTNKAGIPYNIARALVTWWHRDLDDNLRKIISPRRLEYIGTNYIKGIELRYSLLPTLRAPLQHLLRRIDQGNLLPFELTRETLVRNQPEILSEMEENIDLMLAVTERLLAWPDLIPQCIPLFLAMTSELQARLLTNPTIKTALLNLAREGRKGDRNLRPLADRLIAIGILTR
jgi:hypothetical protein